MTAPTPRQFDLKLVEAHARITAKMRELPDVYARAYMAAGWQVGRENIGKISRGGVSKPLEGIVGDPLDPRRPGRQAAIRKKLEGAEKQLEIAFNVVDDIAKDIERAMARLDPPETFDQLRYPISVTQEELSERHEAKERRMARGEIE
jgi:hypothetical protein